ncbi:MAG TPA: hypothetical protein IAA67_03240 [Candidatus Avoscillospira stercorigallinarum]|uniref:Uncharacterized protein n=1 Tax=Candidatus Avoscillospira stercorigallinarum TaxID=2840708 RepID=A0A9D0Z662_9FIRM|nr:hypothetical protein [Candidatus Avoscillospira stercorigallinarum]
MENLSTLLDDKVEVLALRKTGDEYRWERERLAWASVVEDRRRNVFSSVGTAAMGVTVTMRHDGRFDLFRAMRWAGKFLLPTAIEVGEARDRVAVKAAICDFVSPCTATGYTTVLGEGNRPQKVEKTPVTFPGIITGKWSGYEKSDTHAAEDDALVLVTPKEIVLEVGDLVTIEEAVLQAVYNVQKRHLLAGVNKNEYELAFSRDV